MYELEGGDGVFVSCFPQFTFARREGRLLELVWISWALAVMSFAVRLFLSFSCRDGGTGLRDMIQGSHVLLNMRRLRPQDRSHELFVEPLGDGGGGEEEGLEFQDLHREHHDGHGHDGDFPAREAEAQASGSTKASVHDPP